MCIYINIYIYTHTYICIYIHIHIYTYTHIHIYKYIYTYIQIFKHIDIHRYVYVYLHTYMYMSVCYIITLFWMLEVIFAFYGLKPFQHSCWASHNLEHTSCKVIGCYGDSINTFQSTHWKSLKRIGLNAEALQLGNLAKKGGGKKNPGFTATNRIEMGYSWDINGIISRDVSAIAFTGNQVLD